MPNVSDTEGSAGITAGSPFALGFFPYVTNTAPAVLSTQPIMDYTTGTGGTHPGIVIASAGVDPQPGASELLRVKGGAIVEGGGTDTVVIGRGAAAASSNAIAIGLLASAVGSENVAVGHGSQATAVNCTALGSGAHANNNDACAIGSGCIATAAGGTAIGTNATASGAGSIAIGDGPTAAGSGSIAMGSGASTGGTNLNSIAMGATVSGDRATALGIAAQISANFGIAIGNDARVTASDGIAIGGYNGSDSARVGSAGGIAIGTNCVISGAHASCIQIGSGLASFQANTAQLGGPGTPLTVVVLGRGDTAVSPGGMTIRCTSGSGSNNAAGALNIDAPLSTGNIATGTLNFRVGRPGASGSTLQTKVTKLRVNPAAAGDASVEFLDVNNAAGSGAGTLTNVPDSAGSANPGFWLPVFINSVLHWIPCWTS
jgi:hypothetical protein